MECGWAVRRRTRQRETGPRHEVSPWLSGCRDLYFGKGIPLLVLNTRNTCLSVAGQWYHGTVGGILVYEKHRIVLCLE